MHNYFMRVVKNHSAFSAGNTTLIYKDMFRSREKDSAGVRLPDLSVSLYALEDMSDLILAKTLVQHSANIPLSSPATNTVFLRVNDFMKKRECVVSPVPQSSFSFVSDSHRELKFTCKDDLMNFIQEAASGYASAHMHVPQIAFEEYLRSCVEERDLEWMNVVRNGLRRTDASGTSKRLDEAWLQYGRDANFHLCKLADDGFCGDKVHKLSLPLNDLEHATYERVALVANNDGA